MEYSTKVNVPLAFKKDLIALLNRHSMENGSDTPDHILADYIIFSLAAFNGSVNLRNNYYNDNDEEMGEFIGKNEMADRLNKILKEHQPSYPKYPRF
jgi:hypothetical protein